MFRIYFYKKSALVVNENRREFYFTSVKEAAAIPKDQIIAIHPKFSLYIQADILLDVGYEKLESNS